jgi:hypothetical protein
VGGINRYPRGIPTRIPLSFVHNFQFAHIKNIGIVEEKLSIPIDKREKKEYNT